MQHARVMDAMADEMMAEMVVSFLFHFLAFIPSGRISGRLQPSALRSVICPAM